MPYLLETPQYKDLQRTRNICLCERLCQYFKKFKLIYDNESFIIRKYPHISKPEIALFEHAGLNIVLLLTYSHNLVQNPFVSTSQSIKKSKLYFIRSI